MTVHEHGRFGVCRLRIANQCCKVCQPMQHVSERLWMMGRENSNSTEFIHDLELTAVVGLFQVLLLGSPRRGGLGPQAPMPSFSPCWFRSCSVDVCTDTRADINCYWSMNFGCRSATRHLASQSGHVSNSCGLKRRPLEPLQLLLDQGYPHKTGTPIQPGRPAEIVLERGEHELLRVGNLRSPVGAVNTTALLRGLCYSAPPKNQATQKPPDGLRGSGPESGYCQS
jgi:hypothetical protein